MIEKIKYFFYSHIQEDKLQIRNYKLNICAIAYIFGVTKHTKKERRFTAVTNA